ncbi:MAG: hypothetical protein JST35_12065 [Armatimonadetes bacterium]|nr:hypothetical protein [Armatimonadota bacterium]
MKKALILASSVAIAASALAFNSGLNKGERVSPFHPTHVAGPLANTSNCFPCTFQNRPQVQVWVNGDDAKNVLAIAKALDKASVKHEGKEFKSMIVWITDPANMDAAKAAATKFAKQIGSNRVDVSVIGRNDSAVSQYKINLDSGIKNTVFAYRNWTVREKMVNFKADKAGIEALNGAIDALAK